MWCEKPYYHLISAELDELREITKKREEELSYLQEQLSLTRQQVLEKTELIDLLESKYPI